jgi:hypothetical protein
MFVNTSFSCVRHALFTTDTVKTVFVVYELDFKTLVVVKSLYDVEVLFIYPPLERERIDFQSAVTTTGLKRPRRSVSFSSRARARVVAAGRAIIFSQILNKNRLNSICREQSMADAAEGCVDEHA